VSRSALVIDSQTGGLFGIEDMSRTTGQRVYVHSGTGVDSTGYGAKPDLPLATLSAGLALCTANNGDVVYLMPGHAETRSTTGAFWEASRAGVTVVSLGKGPNRGTFTFSHTGAAATISGNGVTFENVLFVCGVDSVTAPLTVSGADVTLRDCEFRDTTDVEAVRWLITTATADRLTLERCFHNGYTAGNAAVNFARLVGCDGAVFRDCRFMGEYSTAIIEFHTTACSKVDITGCVFLETGTTTGAKNVVDTVTGSTWIVRDSYDLAAGSSYSAASGATSSATNARLGRKVTRSAADVFDGTQKALFTVSGGRVLLTHLELEVTTAALDASASNLKFRTNPTVGTDADLSANLDVNADEEGSLYSLSGVVTDATTGGSGGGAMGMARPVVVAEGTVDMVTSVDVGTGGGLGKAELWYIALDDGATVAAA
jgi:hypothetical protein